MLQRIRIRQRMFSGFHCSMINPFHFAAWKYFLPMSSGDKILYFGYPEGIFSLIKDGLQVCAVTPDARGLQVLKDLVAAQNLSDMSISCIEYKNLNNYPDNSFNGVIVHGWDEWVKRIRMEELEFSTNIFMKRIKRVLLDSGFMLITESSRSLIKTVLKAMRLKLFVRGILTFKDALSGPNLYSIAYRSSTAFTLRIIAITLIRVFIGKGIGILFHNHRSVQLSSPLSRMTLKHARRDEGCADIYLGSGDVYTILTPQWIYRMPQSENADVRCGRNYLMLAHLKLLKLSFQCPEPAGIYKNGDRKEYVESRISGEPVNYLKLTLERRVKCSNAAENALIELQSKTLRQYPANDPVIARLISGPILLLRNSLSEEVNRMLESFLQIFQRVVKNDPVQLCLRHGDFKITNILWDQASRFTGIIDWDLSAKEDFVLSDYLTYTAFDCSVANGTDFCQELSSSIFEDFHQSDYLRKFPSLTINRPIFSASVVMAILHFGATHYKFLTEDQKVKWYRQKLERPLCAILLNFMSLTQNLSEIGTIQAKQKNP